MQDDLNSVSVTASLVRWMPVDMDDGCTHLFGFAEHHSALGGLAWTVSSPVVKQIGGRARTLSGRVYSLGEQTTVDDLDEEGKLALRLLVTEPDGWYVGRGHDQLWLAAQKMARHLQLPPPSQDPNELERFVADNGERYSRLRG